MDGKYQIVWFRSENCLKNRFYGAMRKILRRMLRAFREEKEKCKKKLNQDTIIKVLESQDYPQNGASPSSTHNLSILKNDLIKLIIVPEECIIASEVIELTKRMQAFASKSRARVCRE